MGISKQQFHSMHSDLGVGTPEGGGFTVDPRTGSSPTTGIMVSKADGERQVAQADATPRTLVNYARTSRAQGRLDSPGAHLGGWNPGGRADISLDVSDRVTPSPKVAKEYGTGVAKADALTSALELGIARKQDAVFRLDDFKTFPTGVSGDERRSS